MPPCPSRNPARGISGLSCCELGSLVQKLPITPRICFVLWCSAGGIKLRGAANHVLFQRCNSSVFATCSSLRDTIGVLHSCPAWAVPEQQMFGMEGAVDKGRPFGPKCCNLKQTSAVSVEAIGIGSSLPLGSCRSFPSWLRSSGAKPRFNTAACDEATDEARPGLKIILRNIWMIHSTSSNFWVTVQSHRISSWQTPRTEKSNPRTRTQMFPHGMEEVNSNLCRQPTRSVVSLV